MCRLPRHYSLVTISMNNCHCAKYKFSKIQFNYTLVFVTHQCTVVMFTSMSIYTFLFSYHNHTVDDLCCTLCMVVIMHDISFIYQICSSSVLCINYMMTSWHENALFITGPLWRESTVKGIHRVSYVAYKHHHKDVGLHWSSYSESVFLKFCLIWWNLIYHHLIYYHWICTVLIVGYNLLRNWSQIPYVLWL